MSTYNRKYYLHKKMYDLGAVLRVVKNERVILIAPEMQDSFKGNKYARELVNVHQYGIQITYPMPTK